MGTRETPSGSSEPRWGYQNIPDIIGVLCTYHPRGCHSVVAADDRPLENAREKARGFPNLGEQEVNALLRRPGALRRSATLRLGRTSPLDSFTAASDGLATLILDNHVWTAQCDRSLRNNIRCVASRCSCAGAVIVGPACRRRLLSREVIT